MTRPGPRPTPRPAFVPFDRAEIEQSIPRRFEAQVDAHPGRLAVVAGGLAWTYADLDAAANRVANALLARGPVAGRTVVLLIDQGAPVIAAILGALKAGAVYVPLETSHSPALVATVLDEAAAVLILADAAGAALAAEAARPAPVLGAPAPRGAASAASVLRVDDILAGPRDAARPDVATGPDAPAYVYYTSGSTGRPKGVVDTHRNVLHNVARYTNTLGIDADDRLTLLQSPGFSGAVSSLFGALLNGATSAPYDVRREGTAALGAWLVQTRITIYHSVPALFRVAATGAPAFPDLRLVRLEGDQTSRADWLLFRERFAPDALLVNGLGATECGLVRQFFIDQTMPVGEGVVPVGWPVEDMEVRVLDEAGAAAAPGAVGEIAVRSRYLAAGYWRRPDLDARAFAADPDAPGLRTYRTGDLGRMRVDGCLEHLGRLDARVKVRGEWVDLADVEAALLGAPGVAAAAARVHVGATGDARLVGYVVPSGDPAPTVSALRRHVAARLPEPAIPSAVVILAELPLTGNAKVDRAALPPPRRERPPLDVAFVAPRPGLEATLAGIWADVLQLDRVGVHDLFFDLGGDSLRLGQVHARLLDRIDPAVTIVTLFEHPTIHGLARHLETAGASPGPLDGVQERARRQIAAAEQIERRRRAR